MTAANKLKLAITFMLIILAVGTGGYMIILDWGFLDSLYMTIITLSTVGYGEVHNVSGNQVGQLFTIFLIIFGAFNVGFVISAIGGFILEGQLEQIFGRRKMEKKLAKLNNHVILAGYGRVGKQVAMEFARRGEEFVVIEQDSDMSDECYQEGFNLVQGNAADDAVLEHAGIEHARAIVSTLPDDADNVYLSLTARQRNPKLFIIARAETQLAKKKLRRAGADRVVCPHELGGSQMAMATMRPNVVDFMELASEVSGGENIGIEEISIRDGGELTGKTIIEAAIKSKYDAIVVGLRKKNGKLVFNPSGETPMEGGDILVVLGENGKLEQLASDLG